MQNKLYKFQIKKEWLANIQKLKIDIQKTELEIKVIKIKQNSFYIFTKNFVVVS